ncbi:hypothetical protein L7F22_012043 [Adiantum nelumboides]|nr:hypothetical protein [Adiantum nelumboides]
MITWVAVQVCSGEDPCPSSTVTDCYKLASCLPATKDENEQPTSDCCSKVKEIGSFYPDCLCACVTYRLARLMGVNPVIALSIPKRCQIEARPVGYECADVDILKKEVFDYAKELWHQATGLFQEHMAKPIDKHKSWFEALGEHKVQEKNVELRARNAELEMQ